MLSPDVINITVYSLFEYELFSINVNHASRTRLPLSLRSPWTILHEYNFHLLQSVSFLSGYSRIAWLRFFISDLFDDYLRVSSEQMGSDEMRGIFLDKLG
jgi:hypothetical protein